MLPSQLQERSRRLYAQELAAAEEDRAQPTAADPSASSSQAPTRQPPPTAPAPASPAQSRPQQPRRTPARTVSEIPGEKTCWICYGSSTETPDRAFVHPCSCTLLSHPECLLEWLQTRAATDGQAPRCPVCATRIVIKEDRSELLRLYKTLRRKLDKASLVAAVGGVAASGWFVAAAYGAWALKVFMGDQVAQALLLRHENRVPFRFWLNLPLIPFTLILARTPLIDSLLPFLPLTLVLSTHAHTTPLFDPMGLDDLTLKYPPSPTLTLCLLPWLRLVYLRARWKVFNAVLGRRKRYRGLAGMMEEATADELDTIDMNDPQPREPLEVVAEIEVVEEHRHGEQGAQPEAAPADDENDEPPTPGVEFTSRLRVGLGRFTSIVLGALLFPALSSLAGSALFYLASRGSPTHPSAPLKLLRRLLGVSALLAASRSSSSSVAATSAAASWIKQLTSPRLAFSPAVDPVWIRNTFGAGLILLVRDAVELTAGVLEQRRKASRRVVERPFEPSLRMGTDESAPALPGADEWTSGGGVNAAGREAVVHNLL
ncbi:hypothetical protein JCM5296_005016 [Sporobolomyces johnsonii]